MTSPWTTAAVFLGLAATLGVIGVWGLRHAAESTPAWLPEYRHQKGRRRQRRGGVVCLAMAVLFVAFAAVQLFAGRG